MTLPLTVGAQSEFLRHLLLNFNKLPGPRPDSSITYRPARAAAKLLRSVCALWLAITTIQVKVLSDTAT